MNLNRRSVKLLIVAATLLLPLFGVMALERSAGPTSPSIPTPPQEPSTTEQTLVTGWSAPQTIVGSLSGWTPGDNPSIAFDSKGIWHMVYGWHDNANPANYYLTYRNSNGESNNLVQGELACCSSIAFDPDGGLHVVYRIVNGSYGTIMYMNNIGGQWSTPQKIVDSVPTGIASSGDNPSITFDSQGVWHMVYGWHDFTRNGGPGTDFATYLGVDYLTYRNSSGETNNVVQGGLVCCSSTTSDPSGGLHAIYRGRNGPYGTILYVSDVGGQWSTPQTIVGSLPAWATGDNPSIAFDSQGVWHMVYTWHENGNPGADYITYRNSSGEDYNIAQGARVCCPAIAVDRNGGLHVVYRSMSGPNGSITYIRKSLEVVKTTQTAPERLPAFSPSLWRDPRR